MSKNRYFLRIGSNLDLLLKLGIEHESKSGPLGNALFNSISSNSTQPIDLIDKQTLADYNRKSILY